MEYGNCENCHTELEPEWFYEKEYDERMLYTGRVRKAVNCLICPICLKEYVCDDSFDGPWFKPMEPLDQAVAWQELDKESFKDIGNKIYLHILEMSKTSKNINKAELLKEDWITENYLIACMRNEKFCDLIQSKGINIL